MKENARTPAGATHHQVGKRCFSAIFTLEMMLKIYALRSAYWEDPADRPPRRDVALKERSTGPEVAVGELHRISTGLPPIRSQHQVRISGIIRSPHSETAPKWLKERHLSRS